MGGLQRVIDFSTAYGLEQLGIFAGAGLLAYFTSFGLMYAGAALLRLVKYSAN
jgi:hypothetical protein